MTTPHESYLQVNHRTVPVGSINPAPYNPRAMSDGARAGLGASLGKFGLVQPLIWNERTGYLVGGHQRFAWLMSQGSADVTVVVVDLDDDDERALNVALNHRALSGHFTRDVVGLLEEIKATSPDTFESLRFDPIALKFSSAEDLLAEAVGKKRKTEGQCPRCGTAKATP